MSIHRGDRVIVETANGENVTMRALGPPTPGHDFLVVWICTEQEWDDEQDRTEGVPWPADSVRALTEGDKP